MITIIYIPYIICFNFFKSGLTTKKFLECSNYGSAMRTHARLFADRAALLSAPLWSVQRSSALRSSQRNTSRRSRSPARAPRCTRTCNIRRASKCRTCSPYPNSDYSRTPSRTSSHCSTRTLGPHHRIRHNLSATFQTSARRIKGGQRHYAAQW